jgi:hypothetical protein
LFGTTRKPPSAKLEKMGVSAIQFAFGDAASMEHAIKSSQATVVFFVIFCDGFLCRGGWQTRRGNCAWKDHCGRLQSLWNRAACRIFFCN